MDRHMPAAEVVSEEEFTQEFVRNMREHRLWLHPYFELARGEQARSLLRTWAIQAGKIDEVFAQVLENMLDNPLVPPAMRYALRENLDDELGSGEAGQDHFTLFLDVLGVLGVSSQEYRGTAMNVGTRRIVERLLVSSNDWSDPRILALMASEELICPNEFPLFLDACSRYGGRERLRYFDEHIQADVRHSMDLIRLCYAASQGDPVRIASVFYWQQVDLEDNVAFYDGLLA